jgi:tRNA(fMet)-specific endonuclease VapC
MSLPQVILDTDILSALMRKNPNVIAKAKSYLTQHVNSRSRLSLVTRFYVA